MVDKSSYHAIAGSRGGGGGGGGGGRSSVASVVGEVPIFTEEFLKHNRAKEAELRQLRKLKTEYEEQNAILSKHIENFKAAVDKLEAESNHRKKVNRSLEDHLTKLRSAIVAQFSFPSPASIGINEPLTADNVERFLQALKEKTCKEKGVNSNKECDVIVEKVKKIIASMD